MTNRNEEAMWRNRFILMNLLRIGSTIGVLASLVLWQTSIFVQGGTIIGFPLALAFLVASFWGPKWLAGRWRETSEP